MEAWQLIESPNLSGQQNMEFDLRLFHDFEKGLIPSTLRIYSWEPNCISLGYSQKMDRWIDGKMARKLDWHVVKRPTGGGIVFHNEAEVTYSLVTAIDNPMLPRGLVPSYTKISKAIIFALKLMGIDAKLQTSNLPPSSRLRRAGKTQNKSKIPNSKFETQLCFSYPAEYEIVFNGKKIVGSAQKRGKRTLLQQGSIFVRKTPAEVFRVLKKSYQKQNAIGVEEATGRQVSFSEICLALTKGFEECFAISFTPVKCDKMHVV